MSQKVFAIFVTTYLMKNIQHTYNSMLYIHTITIAINKILSNTNVPYRKYKLIKCFN